MQLTPKELLLKKKICLPLDGLATLKEIKARVEELSPVVGLFKIGKETFTRFGPKAVELIKKYEAEVFLDLKYHDIPNTVCGAAKAATRLGVSIFNVHASGGLSMMQAAMEGACKAADAYGITLPKVIAVTVLTSINQYAFNHEMRIQGKIEEQVLHLAKLAQKAGLNGIVCSAGDLLAIKKYLPEDFLYVTPGIKGPQIPAGPDQKRVVTPGEAIKLGASILVIGRAITSLPTPQARLEAGHAVIQDMARSTYA